jgi:hypothetical protein
MREESGVVDYLRQPVDTGLRSANASSPTTYRQPPRDLQETSKFEHPAIPMIDSVLKNITHDWPDDESVEILENVRAATGDGARLILVESVIPPHHRDFSTKWLDLEMLVGNAGRERTADEYRILLHKAGFQ